MWAFLMRKTLIMAIKGIDFRPEVHTGSRKYDHDDVGNDFYWLSEFHKNRITIIVENCSF